jgi:hypothetical protein
VGEACSANGGEEERLEVTDGKAKDTTRKTKKQMGG